MCVTDGWPTAGKMSSYILESDNITGPWKLVVYMKDFGQQGYFLNFPSKFVSENGRKAWLCYSGNYWSDYNGEVIAADPPGSHYGLVLQKIEFLSKEMYGRQIDDLSQNYEKIKGSINRKTKPLRVLDIWLKLLASRGMNIVPWT
jgi:hypothetical protein